MRTILNIVWFVFAGFWLGVGYALAGVLACILVVTIPFGIASFRLARHALWPFGRAVVPKEGAGAGSAIGNVVWFLIAGWWLALAHLVSAIGLAVTIIGIPLAVADLKMIPLALAPFGKRIVDLRDLDEVPDGAVVGPSSR